MSALALLISLASAGAALTRALPHFLCSDLLRQEKIEDLRGSSQRRKPVI